MSPIGAQATDDGGARWSFNSLALGASRDFPVVADPDAGLLAPDKRPPRTARGRSQDGAFVGEGFGPGRVRGGAQFAMDFVLVAVGQEAIEQAMERTGLASISAARTRPTTAPGSR